MKLRYLLLIAAAMTLPACEQKMTTTEKAKDNINDALDRRPHEKVRDAAEDAKDSLKDAGKDVKEVVKDTAKDVKDAAKDATK